MFEHLRWADEMVLEGMERAATAPAHCLELLAHVLGAELIWLDRIESERQSVPVWPNGDLASCRRLAELSAGRWARLLAALEPTDLGRDVAYRNSAGHDFRSTVEEILIHVALHGTYHRGQIATRMRAAGLDPGPTDYIAFTRGAPAATRADRGEGGPE